YGCGSIYRSLAKLEAKFPTTVPIQSRGTAAVAIPGHPAAHGQAKLKVHYSPLVSSSPKEARRDTPRPVVSIPKRHAATQAASNVPTRLRHSMSEFLGHAAAHSPAVARHSGSAV